MNGLNVVGAQYLDRVIWVAQLPKRSWVWPATNTPLTPAIRSTHGGTLVTVGPSTLVSRNRKGRRKGRGISADTYNMSTNRLLAASALAIAITLTAVAAPAEVAAAPAPTKPSATQLYTVKPGEYLSLIASKLHVSLDALLAANGLTKKSVIHPGDQLVVPEGGVLPQTPTPPVAPAATGATYTVKRGDYFKRIAASLGVTMDDLLAANNMKKSTVIHPGDVLQVPAGATVAAPPVVTAAPPSAAKVSTVLDFVNAQLGDPYVRSGAGPDGWDCSGLTMRAYATIGIKLPHYSGSQAKYGQAVDWNVEPIRAGDLVFLATNGVISHVGIATGPNTWIHAPASGDVVRTGNIPMHRVVSVRRLVNGG